MKKIIIPVDFTKASINALHYATQLFKGQTEIDIIHIIQGEFSRNFELNNPRILNNCKNKLQKYITDELAIDELPNNYKLIVRAGPIISSIVNYTNNREYDAMVLATRDKYNMLEKWLGTISFGVMKQLDIPVYLVPIHSKYKGFRKVLVASDYKLENTNSIINISKWNEEHNAFIKFLHIHTNNSPDFKKERENILNGIFEETNASFGFEVATLYSNDISNTLLDKAYNYHADIMVVLPEHQTFLQTLLFKSISKELILQSSIPLLFLPDTRTREERKKVA